MPGSAQAEYPANTSYEHQRQQLKKQARAAAVKDKFLFDKATENRVRKEVLASMQGGQLLVSRGSEPMLVSQGLGFVTYYGFKVAYGPPSRRASVDISLVRCQSPSCLFSLSSLPPSLLLSFVLSSPSPSFPSPHSFPTPLLKRYSYVRSMYEHYKSAVHGVQPERPGFFAGFASRVTEYRTRHDEEVLEQRWVLMQGWLQEMLNLSEGITVEWDRKFLGLKRIEEEGLKAGLKDLMEAELARVEAAYEAQRKVEDEELTRPWFARGVLASMWDDKEDEEKWWREETDLCVKKLVGEEVGEAAPEEEEQQEEERTRRWFARGVFSRMWEEKDDKDEEMEEVVVGA